MFPISIGLGIDSFFNAGEFILSGKFLTVMLGDENIMAVEESSDEFLSSETVFLLFLLNIDCYLIAIADFDSFSLLWHDK